MKKLITCLALVGLCSLALADKPAPQLAPAPQKAVPLTIQRVGSDMQPIGPVMPYVDNGGIAQGWSVAYDMFEADPASGAPSEIYTPSCGMGGSRWWFGSQYRNPNWVNDMETLAAGTQGSLAERYEICWTWYPPSPEACYIFTFTGEGFDFSCFGPPYQTGYDGIVVSFGTGLPNGNWYSDIDLSGYGLALQMPQDGGAMHGIHAKAYTSSTITLASMSYAMLWGTKGSLNPDFPGNNPSNNNAIQWDDDNPVDGSFDPNLECYSYYYGSGYCPGTLGGMFVAYVQGGGGLRCDANCDSSFDGADIDAFFLALADPVIWGQTYSCDFLLANDANCDQSVDGADIDPFFAGLGVGECVCP